jgi:hypothetical protein
MTARKCFTGKIGAGAVDKRAGTQILDMLDQFEADYQARLGDGAAQRQAALDTAKMARAAAAQKAEDAASAAIAQANVRRAVAAVDQTLAGLRAAPGDFGFGNKAPPGLGQATDSPLGPALNSLLSRNPYELANWANVEHVGKMLRGEAHRLFADTIDTLRPKMLGFVDEATRELDMLRAAFGQEADAVGQANAKAAFKVNDFLADEYQKAGGRLAKRENYFPSVDFDRNKVAAIGRDRFVALMNEHNDRAKMTDFATGEPINDVRYGELVEQAYQTIRAGGVEGPATGAARGSRMLGNTRDYPRFFEYKSAESWQAVAEAIGTHSSPYQAQLDHIEGMTRDIALLKLLGRNPEGTVRYAHNLFDREAARLYVTAKSDAPADVKAAAKTNREIDNQVARQRKRFDDLYAEVTGANRVPVNTTMAEGFATARHVLTAAQLGSAMISSLTDPATLLMTARFNGIPAADTLGRAVTMMTESGSEIFAAQMGLVADSLAHVVGRNDQVMGETIRSGIAAKMSGAVIRASGLRRWTAALRGAFGLETMAHVARSRDLKFADLAREQPAFAQALQRYGIGEADWELIRGATPHEPRDKAFFTRAVDVAAGGTPAHLVASEKLSRLITTEMDYAVIEGDAFTRSMMMRGTEAGTLTGEIWRSVLQYKAFPTTVMTMHFARAFARGWDGTRLAHAGLTFTAMTLLGAFAMQAKELAAGRDPLDLTPVKDGQVNPNGLRAWGKAMMQGGGFGVFGDVVFVDKTKHGNSWAAQAAGPMAGAIESVGGTLLIKNLIRASKGEDTHFAGDAAFIAGRYVPGSTLWYWRLGFQRAVVDQAALMVDSRAPERFRRIEQEAQKEFKQSYWWRPGQVEPSRAPELVGGR